MKSLAVATFLAFAVPNFAASAQLTPEVTVAPDAAVLTVQATGEVRRAPDIAIVSAGVVTQAASASDALSQNRNRMARVVSALRAAGIDRADIQTSNLSLNPDYRYQEDRQPMIVGYRANNQVTVTIRDIEDAGAVLDALVEVGANQFNGPTLQIDDADAALDEARRDAMAKARERASLYAAAAGLSVSRILSITEGTHRGAPPPIVVTAARADVMEEAASNIEPGRLSMNSTVTVVFELR